MSDVTVLSALQWGMEETASVSSLLSEGADIIITSLKGSTCRNEEGEISLHSLTAAVFNKDAMIIAPGGVNIDLDKLKKDYEKVELLGEAVDNLFIDERANLILPFHNGSVLMAEEAKGRRSGLRAGDLLDDDRLPGRLSRVLLTENRMELYDEVFAKCKEWKLQFADFIIDTVPVIRYAVEADQKIVVESADGFMKDVSWATYPLSSFERCSLQASLERAAIPSRAVTKAIGVAKAYSESAIDCPFPTLLKDGEAKSLTSTSTKRGWLDLVALDYACYINGIDELCITALSELDKEPQLKVCTGYQIEGEYYTNYPETRKISVARPIYAEFEGWLEDISNVDEYEKLPQKCKEYLDEIERFVNLPISLLVNGKLLSK